MRSTSSAIACLLLATTGCSFLGTRPPPAHARAAAAADRVCFDDYTWPVLDSAFAAGALGVMVNAIAHPHYGPDSGSLDMAPMIVPALIGGFFALAAGIGYHNVAACRRYLATVPERDDASVHAAAATMASQL